MLRYSLHAVPRSRKVWHSRQGLNLQPAVLETAAPSLELREYKTSDRQGMVTHLTGRLVIFDAHPFGGCKE